MSADRHAPARFRDFVVWRRGTLPAADLAPLVAERTWRLLATIDRERRARRAAAAHLSDRMAELVPGLDGPDRAALLTLRRHVHNDRLPDTVPTAATQVDGLADWLASRRREDITTAEAATTLAEETAAARRWLAGMCDQTDLKDGLLLARGRTYWAARGYATAQRLTKKQRTVESTLLGYVCRMALKPSPFGSFTEIGATPWRPPAGGPGVRIRSARLNRGLLTWLVSELYRIDDGHLRRLRPNETAQERDGRIHYFRRGVDGTAAGLRGEGFASVPATPVVRRVIEVVTTERPTPSALADRLAREGMPVDAVLGLTGRLVDAGLLLLDLGIPDQEQRYAQAVVARLGDHPAAEIFGELQRIEDEFAQAATGRRVALLDEVDKQVERCTGLLGVPPVGAISKDRALVFEDVGSTGRAARWSPELVERNAAGFGLLQSVLAVVDQSTIQELGLYRFFVTRYGRDARVGLLDMYRSWTSLAPDDVTALMSGADDDHAAAVLRLRGVLADHLAEVVAGSAGAPEVALDVAWLRDFTAGLPDFLPRWPSLAYRIQLAADRIVLNGAMSGHGVYFSRFASLLDEPDGRRWSLADAVRTAIVDTDPDQADLVAGLGLNITLHPRLAPRTVVYPGSIAEPADRPPLFLPDLLVTADPGTRRLRLVSRQDGAPVTFAPMSFLFPAAGPLLYRFLCAFAPIRSVRNGWWSLLDPSTSAFLPRLLLDDIVLDRATWRRPVDDLPRPSDVECVDGVRAVRAWQTDNGLPDEVFFRMLPPPPAQRGDWVTETRRWAEAARQGSRKPQFLDFRSPLLAGLLVKQARTTPGGTAIFQEALPGRQDLGRPGQPPSAEEFIVECHD